MISLIEGMLGHSPRTARVPALCFYTFEVISLIEGMLGPSPRTARTPGLVYI